MKKIISIVLVVCCVFALFACGSKESASTSITKMFKNNAPTSVEITTKQVVADGAFELNGYSILRTGKFNGKMASVYEYSQERVSTIEEGSGETITDMIIVDTGKKEYLEDKGVRETKNGVAGKWDDEGYDFAPAVGTIQLNVTNKNVKNAKNENGVYTCTIPAAKTGAVLGADYALAYEVQLSISYYEGFINQIVISYEVPESDKFPANTMTITAKYEYGKQTITIQ